MEAQDTNTKRSNVEMMEVEFRPWRPRFPKVSIWLYTKPYGFHLYAACYAAVGILLIIVGVVVSLLLHDGSWLSRCGALITVVSIVFGVHGLEGKIGSDIRYCSEMLKAMEKDDFERKQQTFDGSFEKTPEHITDIVVQSFRKAFAGKREKDWASRTVRNTVRIGAGILVVGTLVWGFGDLLVTPWQASPNSTVQNPPARAATVEPDHAEQEHTALPDGLRGRGPSGG